MEQAAEEVNSSGMTTSGGVSQGQEFGGAGRLAQPRCEWKLEDVIAVHGNQECRMGYIQFSFLCRLKIEPL